MDEINTLKARAYDLLAQIEWCQAQLKMTNQKIADLLKPVEAPAELKVAS